MKIPKDMDFSAIDKDPPHIVKGFEAKQLQGTWYKVRHNPPFSVYRSCRTRCCSWSRGYMEVMKWCLVALLE